MQLIHFNIFVFISTLLFYFLLRKYNNNIPLKNRLYISLYIPLISIVIYFLFLRKYISTSQINDIKDINNILEDGSIMTNLFQSSVDV